MIDLNYLHVLKGMTILDIQQEISTIIPINDPDEDKILTEIPLALYFDQYDLFIHNNWNFIGDCASLTQLIGEKIVDIFMENQDLILKLNQSLTIKVDMSDNGFNGPEALVLHGPDNLIVVWN
jgi:hypothetical protein